MREMQSPVSEETRSDAGTERTEFFPAVDPDDEVVDMVMHFIFLSAVLADGSCSDWAKTFSMDESVPAGGALDLTNVSRAGPS